MTHRVTFETGARLRWHAASLRSLIDSAHTASDGNTSELRCALEVFVPRGPAFLYGGLGMVWLPNSAPSCVTIAEENGVVSGTPLSGTIDVVHWGAPAEYRQAIEQQLPNIANGHSLEFCEAACGEVGSSSALFRAIAITMAKVMTSDYASHSEMSDAIVESFVEQKVIGNAQRAK